MSKLQLWIKETKGRIVQLNKPWDEVGACESENLQTTLIDSDLSKALKIIGILRDALIEYQEISVQKGVTHYSIAAEALAEVDEIFKQGE